MRPDLFVDLRAPARHFEVLEENTTRRRLKDITESVSEKRSKGSVDKAGHPMAIHAKPVSETHPNFHVLLTPPHAGRRSAAPLRGPRGG